MTAFNERELLMTNFKEINVYDLNDNVFDMIGRKWMTVNAGNAALSNAMTASWGGLGVMWGKNVAYVVIRPTRFTKEFVDSGQRFALCFFNEKFKKELTYLGSVSGRNENKIAKSGLTVLLNDTTPYFAEAGLVLFCRKLYAQAFEPACFIEKELEPQWYPERDYHTLYIAEIEKVLIAG